MDGDRTGQASGRAHEDGEGEGWPPTLYDRLISRGTATRGRLAHDLQRLLETRTGPSADDDPDGALTLPAYGLPPLDGEEFCGPGGSDRLCALIARKIEAFEPRLRDVKVTAEGWWTAQTLRLRIEARTVRSSEPWTAGVRFEAGGRTTVARVAKEER